MDANLRLRNVAQRRWPAWACVALLSLGVLGISGCGNDDDAMPPMEEPAQEPDGGTQGESMGGNGGQDDAMSAPQSQDEESGF